MHKSDNINDDDDDDDDNNNNNNKSTTVIKLIMEVLTAAELANKVAVPHVIQNTQLCFKNCRQIFLS